LGQWLEIVVLTTAKCSATYPLKSIAVGFFGSNTDSTEIQSETVVDVFSEMLLLGVLDRSAIVADVTCAEVHLKKHATRVAAVRKYLQRFLMKQPQKSVRRTRGVIHDK
jgi:hypothetical protein